MSGLFQYVTRCVARDAKRALTLAALACCFS